MYVCVCVYVRTQSVWGGGRGGLQAMWILAFSVSFSLLACSSTGGDRGLLEGAPFSGSSPRLTNVGMELPTEGAMCLDAPCSTHKKKVNTKYLLVNDVSL